MNDPRVLLVDDEASLRDALAEMLTFEGFRADQAGSVGEALDAFEPFAFDAVVTDLRLPDGSGLERLTFGRDYSPRWSPDGTKILFRRLGDLYVMDSDGGRQTLLPFRLPDEPELLILGADWGR